MLKCSSIGEIPTLSKHFHFQNCLWPSLLRSRKSDRISSGGWGNRAPERRPLCVCRERVCWKEWMSGEQGSPKDAVAFINSLAQLYGHLQIYTCNNIPPPLPRTQKPQGVAGKYHSAPAWAERASVPCTGRGRCKLTCPLLIPFVLHTHVLRVRPGCGAQLERGAEDKVRLGRTGKLGGRCRRAPRTPWATISNILPNVWGTHGASCKYLHRPLWPGHRTKLSEDGTLRLLTFPINERDLGY